jgi:tetratricopeptide (TPR) repeat protein
VALGHKANEVPAEWVQRIANAHKATDPNVKNDVAYQLAMGRVAIADAHSLADEAVGQAERATAELSLQDADGMGFVAMERLSHYWVTLGLVYFREGQLDKAEAYMRASWELDPRGHVANHLGRVYEAEHRDADAIAVYRQALGARGSEGLKQNVREQLEKLAGTEAPEPLPVDATVQVAMTPMAGSAVFDILSSHAGTQEVVLVTGDARFKSATDAIRAVLPTGIPDGGPERLLRRGRLSCAGASGCQLQLLTPQEARTAVSGTAAK